MDTQRITPVRESCLCPRHRPDSGPISHNNLSLGAGFDEMPSGKVAEGGEQRHLGSAAKAWQSQALAAPTVQLEDWMQMPGDDVIASLSGGRVRSANGLRTNGSLTISISSVAGGSARAPVMVAANQRAGEPGVALSPFVQRGQGGGRVGFRRV